MSLFDTIKTRRGGAGGAPQAAQCAMRTRWGYGPRASPLRGPIWRSFLVRKLGVEGGSPRDGSMPTELVYDLNTLISVFRAHVVGQTR